MTEGSEFRRAVETKVAEQLRAQRVGYLLGAGSSYLDGKGYPLASEVWGRIRGLIADEKTRDNIQAQLDRGASGLEHALDLLDHGGAIDPAYRQEIGEAIAQLFMKIEPPLDTHVEFVRRLSVRANPAVKVFNLNYDPLVEWAADLSRVRLVDGFAGTEHAFFEANVFQERIGRIRGMHKGRQFEETVRPIHLLKLHGSMGWYECASRGVRRCAFCDKVPNGTKRLMIPPQRRKAADTMLPPYSALWSAFRGCLGQDVVPLNRLVCIGYGFADEHVNTIIEPALARGDFTLLILTRSLSDTTWTRWSAKANAVVVTEARSALKGEVGAGHPDLWSFERLCKEV